MRHLASIGPRGRVLAAGLGLGLLLAAPLAAQSVAPTQPAAPVPPTVLAPAAPPVAADTSPLSTEARIVVVEWKIKKGQEQEFRDYWAKKSTIPDRSGLIAEFLSGEEDRAKFPWINWAATRSDDYTVFYNVGIWRRADDFMGQIGKYIDNNRPPMAFEAARRSRVFLQPLEWRVGQSQLPAKDAEGVN
jgi:hypothetical protein